jgi:chromosome segregation ATPase
MNLFNRISLGIRAAANNLNNLVGAPASQPAPASAAQSAALLKAAQQRADRLNDQLLQAETHERNAEQAWRDARSEADAIELELNAAVRTGQDEVACAKLTQLNQAQNNVQRMSDRWHTYATTSEKLRIEIQDLQSQLAAIRKRSGRAALAPTSAASVAQAQLRLSQPAQTSAPAQNAQRASGLGTSPKPDTPAAPPQPDEKELDQTRIADLLKKRDTPSKP